MRYLVTGGAGFIGSKVATYLIARGHTVIVVDNLCTGARDRVPPEAEFVHADLSRDYWKSDVGRIDGIFHLAAMSKVAPSLRDSSMMRFCAEANIIATMNVLNFAACQDPVPKVVYSASSTMYGQNPVPQREDMRPDMQTPYALSKYVGELSCEMYTRLYGVPTVRLRYFMVFGEGQPSSGPYAIVSGIFERRKAEGRPLEIHGDGRQTRDFVNVDDVARANYEAMLSDNMTDVTINVGTGVETSIQNLANAISSNQVHTAARKIDLRATRADTSKFEELFGWLPENSIIENAKGPR